MNFLSRSGKKLLRLKTELYKNKNLLQSYTPGGRRQSATSRWIEGRGRRDGRLGSNAISNRHYDHLPGMSADNVHI